MTLTPTRIGYVDWECPVCHGVMWLHQDDGDETEVKCRVCANQMTAGEVRRGLLATADPPSRERTWIDDAALGAGLAGDFARVAKSVRDRLAGSFPDGCALDRVEGTCEGKRCVLTITITIEAKDEP